MVLLDSSIWIEHFRKPIAQVYTLADRGLIWGHPFVTGELAIGSLPVRHALIAMLRALPQSQILAENALLDFVESSKLNALGLGLVDIHLLGATNTMPEARLWTRDKRLAAQAERLGLNYHPA